MEKECCYQLPSWRRQSSSAASPAPMVHNSLMEAYVAAAPGSIIKLRAGRHMISPANEKGNSLWEELVYSKSLQVRCTWARTINAAAPALLVPLSLSLSLAPPFSIPAPADRC